LTLRLGRSTTNVAIIANPASGKGRGAEIGRTVQEELRERGHVVTLVLTERRRHATELARRAALGGQDAVAVVGGDGTVSECAEGLLGTECRLALVPAGTGNDLARGLGIPSEPAAVAEIIHAGRTRHLDVWRLNDRAFVNVAGVGFDAEVAARMAEPGHRVRGTAGYLLGVLSVLHCYRPRTIRLAVDETAFTGRVMMVALANAPYYGGGMKVAPAADPSDGLLDVIVIQEVSRLRFLRQFPRVFRGTHVTDPAVKQFRGRAVIIDGDPDTPVMVDGEPCGTLPARVECTDSPLSILVP
jgi:diacylglycerol kinase (ATP)